MAVASSKTVSIPKVVSLRDHVRGAVVEFLGQAGMACLKTQDGLVTLIGALARYTEEGRVLFPEVFVFDDLALVQKLLGSAECVAIGEEPKDPSTMGRALKRCAPLARDGWAIYIERRASTFAYGILRCGTSTLSLSAAELLVDKGDDQSQVLVVRQIGKNLIEVKSSSQSNLVIHFGATREGEASAMPGLTGFVTALTEHVSLEIQEQTISFFNKLLLEIVRAEHGTLAVVMPGKRNAIPLRLREGIMLSPKISIPDRVRDLVGKADSESEMRLRACGTMVSGMLLSDGITLFGSDGCVRAYNIFVKHPRASQSTARPLGGARTRTFNVLSSLVGKELTATFMLSQDGHVEVKGGK